MNISKYMAFEAAVKYKSFTEAAEALCYSQSAVSRMIADLERQWGMTLLERGKGGVEPTSDGLKMLPYAKKLCDDYRDILMQLDEMKGLKSGLIRIGTFSSVAQNWLPEIIMSFQKEYPNIDYELLLGDYTEIEDWLKNGRVDCGFLRLPAKEGIETYFLQQDRFMAVLPEGHRLSLNERVSLAQMCDDPFLMLEKGENTEISDIFKRSGLTPKTKLTLWDDYAIMSMVEKGMGISILPALILKHIPYGVAVKELDVTMCRNIGFAVRSKKEMPLSVRRFFKHIESGIAAV